MKIYNKIFISQYRSEKELDRIVNSFCPSGIELKKFRDRVEIITVAAYFALKGFKEDNAGVRIELNKNRILGMAREYFDEVQKFKKKNKYDSAHKIHNPKVAAIMMDVILRDLFRKLSPSVFSYKKHASQINLNLLWNEYTYNAVIIALELDFKTHFSEQLSDREREQRTLFSKICDEYESKSLSKSMMAWGCHYFMEFKKATCQTPSSTG